MIVAILGVSAVAIIACHYIYRCLFERPSIKNYVYPYKEPDTLFRIKYVLYWIREVLFRKYYKRFNDFDLLSNDIRKTGIVASELQEKLEVPQNIISVDTMDETGFMGVNLTTGNVLHVSVSKRQHYQTEAIVHLVINDKIGRMEFQLPFMPRTLKRNRQEEGNCWTSGDLKIYCLCPLTRWRISFNGLLRNTATNEMSYVIFSFLWAPFSRVVDHKDDSSTMSRARALALSGSNDPIKDLEWILNQYDTWGTFFGTYSIDKGEETEMILFGSKTRRTGEFHSSDVHKFLQIKGYVQDGSTFAFNAINIPKRVPEMIWGYVELGNGNRELVKTSDFELLRLQNEDSPPKLLTVRFNSDEDDYILQVASDNGTFTHLWGQNEEMKVNCDNVKVCLTSLKHNIRLNGSGSMSTAVKNDLGLEPPEELPPLLTEPDIDATFSSPNILEFSEESCKSPKLVGGKGSSLAILKQIKSDFQVPNGLCITVAANMAHIKENERLENSIQRISDISCGKIKLNSVQEDCMSLGKIFEETELSSILKQELKKKMLSVFGEELEQVRFAVRSSAIGEDGEEMSAAGQMESILGCKGFDQICAGVKKCWASCYGFRAVEYRRQNGQQIEVGMAVVVQEMVAAEKAGVLFTRDPFDGNPSVISIAANYGIGESVVSAMSEPDSIVVNRTYDDKLSLGDIVIGKKELKITMKDGGGVEQKKLSEENMKLCCLSNEQILKLAQYGVLVEQSYGNARDLEWAISEDQIYLLQARPITNLHTETEYFLRNELNTAALTDEECGNSGNFKEVFPGATSTLSNSFFNMVLALFSESFASKIGRVDKPNTLTMKGYINFQQHRFSDRGRMFYSLLQKNPPQRALHFRHGLDVGFNGRVMSNEEFEAKQLVRNRYAHWMTFIRQMLNSIKGMITVKKSLKLMNEKFSNYEIEIDFSKSNEEIAKALFGTHKPFFEALSYHVEVTMASMTMNCMVLVSLLGKEKNFSEVHYADFAQLLSVDSGTEAVESADVPTALQVLANEIIAKCDSEKFIKMSNEEVIEFLTSDQCPVKDNYRDFITRHGHRCVKEFDVQAKTWAMKPSKLSAPLQAMVRAKDLAKNKKLTIDEALEQLQTKLSSKEKKSVRKDVLKARELVGYREQAKSLLINVVNQYRKKILKFSQKLVSEGRLPDAELIFYMCWEEIISLTKTRSAKIIQRAIKRKKLHPKMDSLKFPETFFGLPKPIGDTVDALEDIDGKTVLKV